MKGEMRARTISAVTRARRVSRWLFFAADFFVSAFCLRSTLLGKRSFSNPPACPPRQTSAAAGNLPLRRLHLGPRSVPVGSTSSSEARALDESPCIKTVENFLVAANRDDTHRDLQAAHRNDEGGNNKVEISKFTTSSRRAFSHHDDGTTPKMSDFTVLSHRDLSMFDSPAAVVPKARPSSPPAAMKKVTSPVNISFGALSCRSSPTGGMNKNLLSSPRERAAAGPNLAIPKLRAVPAVSPAGAVNIKQPSVDEQSEIIVLSEEHRRAQQDLDEKKCVIA
ncbi:unnamed protein product [Amoebophrya sp. A120]|nr:unnamed protein product [Amoebophrya sp. A120]|eukprot:GSA120T00017592001.1